MSVRPILISIIFIEFPQLYGALHTNTVGIRRSLLIFENHIFEGLDEILYIYTFF